MNLASWCRVALTIGLVTACGDDGGNNAEKKCLKLLEAVCEKMAECDDDIDVDDCIEELDDEAECGEAEKVPEDYDDCLDDIESAECSEDLESQLSSCDW